VEVRLESCPVCREALAGVVSRNASVTHHLVEQVRTRLAAEMSQVAPAPAAQTPARGIAGLTQRVEQRLRPWFAPTTLPRVLMTVVMVAAAVGLDLADDAVGGRYPSLVLLVAPVVPLVGVSAVWARGIVPAYELVVASPRAGLELVLRRTLVALLVAIPVLGAAGAVVGVSPARWLVPSLALVAGALALGGTVGLQRAAQGLGVLWAVAVVAPSLVLARPSVPAGLDPDQRLDFRALLRELAVDTRVVVSTHLVEDVAAACTDVLLLDEGRLVFQGTPGDLVAAGEAASVVSDSGDAVDSAAERGYSAIMRRHREQQPGQRSEQDVRRDSETWEAP
jgi:hypothetical protein